MRLTAKTFEVLIPVEPGVQLLLRTRLFLSGGVVVGVRSCRLSQVDGTGIKEYVNGVEEFDDETAAPRELLEIGK